MRAREFIIEQQVGDISKRQRYATVGLNKFRDASFADRVYELNRVMMAAAATDGTFVPDIDEKTWFGKSKTAHPYTKQEQDMLKMAYKAANARYDDINNGDMDSEEHPEVNAISPIKGFRGY